MKVFEYIVVQQGQAPDDLEQPLYLLTDTPQLAVAGDAETVKKRAIRDTPLPDGVNIDDVEVIVRPFA